VDDELGRLKLESVGPRLPDVYDGREVKRGIVSIGDLNFG